ncbi:1-deoxy-D-xylulose-5-phosphate reductoisomerase [bacterium Unc6]|nr:1-deoxy-D-xylulose-5-phosphate reductoisomerase [bacterium Unc6]
MQTITHIAILGSTGCIGTDTLEVIDTLEEGFKVVALAAGENIKLLEKQCKKYVPSLVVVQDEKKAEELKKRLTPLKKTSILWGEKGLIEAVKIHSETVVIATSGSYGLTAILSAIQEGKRIAIANKEPIVMAGSLIMEMANRCGSQIIPVDSEHSAIFQCLSAGKKTEVHKIYLTGSGGALRGYSKDRIGSVDIKNVLSHPKWKMGKKITVDSATLMNKGLEVIEATHLFDIPSDKIEVLIHPQAIVHSFVEFIDGSVVAQLSDTDMKIPIQYALTYPLREKSFAKYLNLIKIKNLTFEKPDKKLFPCLALGYKAAKIGGTLPCVMSIANEVAVEKFLKRQIKFIDIPKIIFNVMKKHRVKKVKSVEDVIESAEWAKREANSISSGNW